MNYLKDRKADAPAAALPSSSGRSPLDLQPAHSHPDAELPSSLSMAARQVAKQHSKPVTTGMTGSDHAKGLPQQRSTDTAKQQRAAGAGSTTDETSGVGAARPHVNKTGVLYKPHNAGDYSLQIQLTPYLGQRANMCL